MGGTESKAKGSLLPGVLAMALATAYLIALLAVEKQMLIIGLLALAIIAVLAANWLGWLAPVSRSFEDREEALGMLAIAAAFAIAAYFHDDHFVLLLVCTVLLYTVATLGLNIQFGYAGVLNFAGASFFGIGAYTSAVLNTHTAVPASACLADRRTDRRADRVAAAVAGSAHARALRGAGHDRIRAAAENVP